MDAKTYEASIAHLMYKDGEPIPLDVCMLGLCGESGELIEENDKLVEDFDFTKFQLEVGDVMWYVAATCSKLGRGFHKLKTTDKPLPNSHAACITQLAVNVAKAADMIKKHMWHGKVLDEEALCEKLVLVMEAVYVMCDRRGTTLEQAAQANVDKLRARYPLGFVEGGGVRA